MDANNNPPTAKYRRESLSRSETNNSLSIDQEPEKQALSNFTKYYLFALTSTIYLIYGCQNSLLGPTMKALTRMLHITEEDVSIVVAVKCAVIILSTPVVSFSFKKIGHRQFQFAAAAIIFSVLGGAVPYLSSFTGLLVNNMIAGFFIAIIEAVVNLTVLELFSLNSKIYMQMAHGCFTVGTVFGPLLSGPFLSKSDNKTDNSTTTPTPSTSPAFELNEWNSFPKSEKWNEIAAEVDDSLIRVPYLIVSSLLIVAAIWLIVSQILRPYVPEKRKLVAKQTSKKVVEERPEDLEQPNGMASAEVRRPSSAEKRKVETVVEQIDLPQKFYVTFLSLVGVLFMCYLCMEILVGMFLPSFMTNELGFEESEAASMSSVVFVSMAVGRVFTIVFSNKITCKFMLFFNFSITLLGFLMLTFFAMHSRSIIWLSSILIGAGLSSTYPIILSYVENRIVISSNVQLYLLLSSLVLLMFVPIWVGHFIQTAPMLFAYVNLTMAIVTLSLMFFMHMVDVWKRSLIKQIKEKQGNFPLAEEPLDFNI